MSNTSAPLPDASFRASNNPLDGARCLLDGARMLTRPRVRPFVLLPLTINVLLFGSVLFLGIDWASATLTALLPSWLGFLSWIIVPLLFVIGFAIAYFAFSLIANLIAAPFNGYLAEVIERELSGRGPPQAGIREMLDDAVRAIGYELRKLAYVVIRIAPLLLLFLVPVVNLAAGPIWMLATAWMLAITYGDFAMSNHLLSFRQQRALLGTRKGLALGFGAAVLLGMSVPLLNFLVMPCAVAGGAVLWVRHLRDDAPPPERPRRGATTTAR